MMFVMRAARIRAQIFDAYLAVLDVDRQYFAARKALERAALVGLQMSRCGSHNGFVRL